MDIKDVVSKDEVNELLNDDDDKNSTADGASADFDVYDFSSHSSKQVNDLSAIDMINEVFVSEIRSKLSHFLARNAYMIADAAAIVSFDSYLEKLEQPLCIYFVGMKPLTGLSISCFGTDTVNKLLEILFGGDINYDGPKDREFNKVELRVINLLLSIINETLSDAWKAVKPLKFELVQATTKASLLSKHHEEKAIINEYKLCIDKLDLSFSHCIPISTIEPILHLIEGRDEDNLDCAERMAWRKAFVSNIYGVRTPVTAVAANVSIKLHELQKLKVGDIISIDNPTSADVFTGDIHMYHAKCGVNNGNRAIRVVDTVED